MNLRPVKLTFLICLEYVKRKKIYFGSIFILAVIFLILQFKFSIFSKNELRIGLVGTYQEHDIPQDVTKLVSESLVEGTSDGKMKPNLVSGWDVNNDATQFKFKLKDNLKWSDGTQIKAADLTFDIPNTEINVLDDKVVQFKLKESYSPFPSLLTKPIFKKGTFLGTGPYKILKIEKSRIFIKKITLVSEDKSLPAIIIRFYPSEKVAKTGFDVGEVQVLMGLSNSSSELGNPQIKIKQKVDFTKIVTILYSTKDPLLSNRSLRQALSFITPKIEGEIEANNPYPQSLWIYNKDSKKYLAQKNEANAAMERAKSTVSDEKLKAEIILTTTPNLQEVAKEVEKQWKILGFNVKIRVESGIPQNFQALLITQSIPLDPDQYFLWHSSQQNTNLSKYSSVRVDKDLEDGRKALTESERKEKYFDFQHVLLEDAPATFLYFPKYNILYLKKVEKSLDKILSL